MTETDTRAQVSHPINHLFIPAGMIMVIAFIYLFTLDWAGVPESDLMLWLVIGAAGATYVAIMFSIHKLTDGEATHG